MLRIVPIILALALGIPTFIDLSKKWKVIFLIVFVVVLFIDSNIQEKEKTQTKNQMDKLIAYVTTPVVSKEELADLNKNPNTGASTTLKAKTKDLSNEILTFLGERGAPPSPRPETWNEDVQKMLQFSEETRNLYALKFGARVQAIRNQLAEAGIPDGLEMYHEDPVNPLGMREVGVKLGAVAEQMP